MHIYKRLDLLIASFLINALALAIPVYIIHSINRYLGNGNFDTLVFLTVAVIVATCLEHLIRKYRKLIIININNKKFSFKNGLLNNKNFQLDDNVEKELNYIKSLKKKIRFKYSNKFFGCSLHIIVFSCNLFIIAFNFFIVCFLSINNLNYFSFSHSKSK